MPRVKKIKSYVVFCKKDNFLYGAFPFNNQGLKLAKSYVKKLSPKDKKKFCIRVK